MVKTRTYLVLSIVVGSGGEDRSLNPIAVFWFSIVLGRIISIQEVVRKKYGISTYGNEAVLGSKLSLALSLLFPLEMEA